MRSLHIDQPGAALDFQSASLLAKKLARENQMQDPTIMAWHRPSAQGMSPAFDGADPDTWWEKFGAGNGGSLEVSVGEGYQFIMMDASGYETLGEIPLRNLSDGRGNEFLCFAPLMSKSSNMPTEEACTPLDEWLADQF